MHRFQSKIVLLTLLGALAAACAQRSAQGTAPAGASAGSPSRASLETRPAIAAGQRPTFAGQTRAPAARSTFALEVTVLARGLEKPWAVEPLPGGDLLVSEKPGRLHVVSARGQVSEPIAGLPPVDPRGQGGLLDVALSPGFASDRMIYWSYTEPREGGNGTSVARGRLSADRARLEQVQVIFRALPAYDNTMHFGSRLAFGPDQMLYVTLGERSDIRTRPQAQQLDSHLGKIVRIRPDGTVPPDNPFIGRADALPEIWTLGHRNIQAAAFDLQGRLWVVEMGTAGGDELNRIERGKNYGWPAVAYGQEYSGAPISTPGIGRATTVRADTEQPAYYWDPVIAPSGAQFYTGEAFAAWRGSLFVGGMKDRELVRLVIDGGRVTGEERLLGERGQRVRDVRQGDDGALYIVTDQQNGELWKVTPRN